MIGRQPQSRRAGGFTLTEVLVAVPLLVLVFWITGNIFTTTRDTVDLGMVHSKVTASAESAVQRVARDCAGMRPDGRCVVLAGRIAKRPLARDDTVGMPGVGWEFPGTWGQLAFIGQGTYVSQYAPYARSNLARIWYYPAKRPVVPDPPFAYSKYDYWNSDVVLRDVTLFVYAEQATAVGDIADEGRPVTPQPAPDVLAWKAFTVSVGHTNQIIQRQDLMKRAIQTFRTADPTNIQNRNGLFPLAGGSPNFHVYSRPGPTWYPYWNPNDAADAALGATLIPDAMLKVMLVRCGLIDNGDYPPPDGYTGGTYNVTQIGTGANVVKNYYPPGVPQVDPNPNVAAKDPGAASMFQVWTRDTPGGVDNWLPRASDVPAPGSFWMRRYMFLKDAQDQVEYNSDVARNRAPNSASPVPWPTAVRFNFQIFDKVGRFRQGALFQAVMEVPASRL